MNNGERVERDWITYSVKLDAIHCFCCLLFDINSERTGLISDSGFRDWSHLSQRINQHEATGIHITNYITWKEYLKQISANRTIDAHMSRIFLEKKKQLKLVFERILSILFYLARQGLAFRGAENRSGNFNELVKTVAEFDLVMKIHLESADKTKYLSPKIQNEFIDHIGTKLRNNILGRVIKNKYYSIIADCTPDKSRKEQMTFLIRYVDEDIDSSKYVIRESFMGYTEIVDKTGLGIYNIIMNE